MYSCAIGEEQAVVVWGVERKGWVKEKDKSEIALHKESKGSINITLPDSHSNSSHYRDCVMKLVM